MYSTDDDASGGGEPGRSNGDRSPQTENQEPGTHLHRASDRASRARRHPTSDTRRRRRTQETLVTHVSYVTTG